MFIYLRKKKVISLNYFLKIALNVSNIFSFNLLLNDIWMLYIILKKQFFFLYFIYFFSVVLYNSTACITSVSCYAHALSPSGTFSNDNSECQIKFRFPHRNDLVHRNKRFNKEKKNYIRCTIRHYKSRDNIFLNLV